MFSVDHTVRCDEWLYGLRDETKTEIRTNTGRPLPFASLVNPHSDANEASFCRRQVISLRGVAESELRRVRLADLHFI
ncbi:hypothetical protein E2C01_016431 [Portunus trituberculatus]|uniref:Uncharacterized protein n=1 Tax=Portunus trituberculatus TaxID=210409 RepID=A0A5B7DQI8_PORTR|nr:hypothetical protein [Portunus trituberculatus]